MKVLLCDVVDDVIRRRFDAEANLMARVSTHPAIVTIYEADIANDGRPFIVMEHCPHPSLGMRFRRERISVAEALRIGIQIVGAAETAHRVGIVHRDIKPANILFTGYNHPALTDFGISAATGLVPVELDVPAGGMSIPWSAPEVFEDPAAADVRSDVFSLAATIYSLLAGRSPFELGRGRNHPDDLIARIENDPPRAIGRSDAPDSLERVLLLAMSKRPAARYCSALVLGRALQQVEYELSLPATPMDVPADPSRGYPIGREVGFALSASSGSDPRQQLDLPIRIGRRARPAAPSVSVEDSASRELAAGLAGACAVVPGSTALLKRNGGSRAPRIPGTADRRTWPAVVAASGIIAAVGLGSALSINALVPASGTPSANRSGSSSPDDLGAPAAPGVITGSVSERRRGAEGALVAFVWEGELNRREEFVYRWSGAPAAIPTPWTRLPRSSATQLTVQAPAALGKSPCIDVKTRRLDGTRDSAITRGCAR